MGCKSCAKAAAQRRQKYAAYRKIRKAAQSNTKSKSKTTSKSTSSVTKSTPKTAAKHTSTPKIIRVNPQPEDTPQKTPIKVVKATPSVAKPAPVVTVTPPTPSTTKSSAPVVTVVPPTPAPATTAKSTVTTPKVVPIKPKTVIDQELIRKAALAKQERQRRALEKAKKAKKNLNAKRNHPKFKKAVKPKKK